MKITKKFVCWLCLTYIGAQVIKVAPDAGEYLTKSLNELEKEGSNCTTDYTDPNRYGSIRPDTIRYHENYIENIKKNFSIDIVGITTATATITATTTAISGDQATLEFPA